MRRSLSQSRRKHNRGPAPTGFPAKAKLFDPDHPSRHLYLLRSGRVRLANGREVIFDYLTPGDLFGEKHLLTPQPRGQIATALSPVRVLTFRKSELPALVRRDSRLAQQMLKNLALRLDRYEDTIRYFVTEQAERRLARLLVRLMPTRTKAEWTPLRFSPSNSELAKTVGTTRARIAHFMRHFQQLGWLGRRPGLWVRPEGLRAFLQSTSGRRT
jgi:CRP-like cAMP-binding protein